MIKFATLKLVHNYAHKKLPFSFIELWQQNRQLNPVRELRNANDLKIPSHHMATVNKFPLFSFPRIWNEENARKHMPSVKMYSKQLKAALLVAIPL
jgi:hypothetical protein